MSYLDHLAPLFKATQRLDGGIVVLDRSWRIVYSNAMIREVYPGFAFLSDATYDDLLWHCINNHIIDSPDIYADPEQYISNLRACLTDSPYRLLKAAKRRLGCGQTRTVRNTRLMDDAIRAT